MCFDSDQLSRSRSPRLWLTALLLLVFLAIAPTLGLLEFANGSENLNVTTCLELRRDGWSIIPTLNGRPRLAKPPLTAWLTTLFIPQHTVEQMASTDPAERAAGQQALEWEVRLVALTTACLMLGGIYSIARTLEDDSSVGLIATAVAASTLLFLRYTRASTTDVQLAFWVTICNAALVRWALRGRVFPELPLAGISLGLAIMCKGPVAIVQTVVPVLVFVVLRRALGIRSSEPSSSSKRSIAGWIALVSLMLLVALPWPLYVLLRNQDALSLWRIEITREGATTLAPDPWYSYFSLLPNIAPWTIFFVIGFILAVRSSRAVPGRLLAICLLIVPIVVMSLVKDKNDRYLLPMVAPVAALVSVGIRQQLRPRALLNNADHWVRSGHWAFIAVSAIGFPLASLSAKWMPTTDGGRWFTPAFAIGAAVVLGLSVLLAIWLSERRKQMLVPTTLLIMLALNAMFVVGYAKHPRGRSELKPLADSIWAGVPDADVRFYDPGAPINSLPQDLPIYLNRLVTDIDEPTRVPLADGRRHIIVMVQRAKEPPPVIDGWRPLVATRAAKRLWWAFEPLAAPATQP